MAGNAPVARQGLPTFVRMTGKARPKVRTRSGIGSWRKTGMTAERSPHLTPTEVRHLVGELDAAEGQARRDLMTRLAWRPAWAIRSRRNAVVEIWAWLRRSLGRA